MAEATYAIEGIVFKDPTACTHTYKLSKSATTLVAASSNLVVAGSTIKINRKVDE